MTHEDQTEFYECPLCGSGTGNDIDGIVEHECEIMKEMSLQKESEWEKRLNDLERKTERGMYWVRLDMVRDIICEAVLSREKEIEKEIAKMEVYDDEPDNCRRILTETLSILKR